ncbi:MAG: endonuclease/exonuclease/phosphatase family protein [Candidatus Helarchaeota archaeon]
MNRNFKLILVLLIILGIPIISTISVSTVLMLSPPPQESDGTIVFLTYNLHFGVGMDDRLDLERLAQNILTANPDIVGLQEVENGRITSQGIDMAYWFAKRLGMYYYYYPAVNEEAFGVALLSKYPIVAVKGYDLTSEELERVMVHGVIRANSTLTVNVFVVHLGLEDENTTRQIQEILAVTDSVTGPKVLMGDFNLNDTTNQIGNVTLKFDDTAAQWAGNSSTTLGDTFPSFPAPEAGNRIDYIFASGYSAIVNSRVLSDFIPGIHTAAEFGSDHLPVTTTLRF